jgi:ABC-type multidrug transport system permease subunit
LSPLYLPFWLLPHYWQDIAYFLPGTYAAVIVQSSVGLLPVGVKVGFGSVFDSVLLAVAAVAGTGLAVSLYKWGEK